MRLDRPLLFTIALIFLILVPVLISAALSQQGTEVPLKGGYVSGGSIVMNQTRITWSFPIWDTVNYSYRIEFWNSEISTLLRTSLTIASQNGSVAFTASSLPNVRMWIKLVGINKNPDVWCDNASNWYYVQEIKEKHCTPDIVADYFYITGRNLTSVKDPTFLRVRSLLFKYQNETPKGLAFKTLDKL
jgi:hypothetical protein